MGVTVPWENGNHVDTKEQCRDKISKENALKVLILSKDIAPLPLSLAFSGSFNFPFIFVTNL
jgi:hypothetical protein